MNRPEQAPERASAEAVASLGRGAGLALSLAGLIGWIGWLSWRFATLEKSIVAVGVLTLGLVAISAALVVTAGLFAGRPQWRRGRRATDADCQLPMLLGEALGLGDIIDERDIDPTDPTRASPASVGPDDTGEIAWARRGLRVLGDQRRLDRWGPTRCPKLA